MESEQQTSVPQTHEERMEQMMTEMNAALHRMDMRDRTRMIWGTVKSLINLIPMLLLLWSTYYLFVHGPELIQMITSQTVKQMTGIGSSPSSDSNNSNMLQMLEQQLQGIQVKK